MSNTTVKDKIDQLGNALIELFHIIGLFVIGATIVWSSIHEYLLIMQHEGGFATLKDILLLFIYLELGAMTGIYFKTHKMPVVFLIFIAITAITRFLVIDMKSLVAHDKFNIIAMVSAILVLSIAAGVLKYTEKKYQSDSDY